MTTTTTTTSTAIPMPIPVPRDFLDLWDSMQSMTRKAKKPNKIPRNIPEHSKPASTDPSPRAGACDSSFRCWGFVRTWELAWTVHGNGLGSDIRLMTPWECSSPWQGVVSDVKPYLLVCWGWLLSLVINGYHVWNALAKYSAHAGNTLLRKSSSLRIL